MNRQPTPRPSRLRALMGFFRQHQAFTAIMFVLAVMTAVAISLIRDDPVVVSQLEMASLASGLQDFGHMPYRVRLSAPLANATGLVPNTLNAGNTSMLQPLVNQWGGQVKIRGNPEKSSEYDIVYEGLPSYACRELTKWAVTIPLFEQVMLNGAILRETKGEPGQPLDFNESATKQRCTGNDHLLALRVEVPLKNRTTLQE